MGKTQLIVVDIPYSDHLSHSLPNCKGRVPLGSTGEREPREEGIRAFSVHLLATDLTKYE